MRVDATTIAEALFPTDGAAPRGGSGRVTPRDQARAARATVERALDAAGWPWSRRLSLWLDALLIVEEAARR